MSDFVYEVIACATGAILSGVVGSAYRTLKKQSQDRRNKVSADINVARGRDLDVLGATQGIERGNESDEDLRRRIQARLDGGYFDR